ncbi:MAG: FtsX-like permease family protein [Bacteroidota bacterium]
MTILISWKNVWRNKARSFIILNSTAIGLFGGIFSYALMMGSTIQRIDSAIKNETSSFQLHNPAYLQEEDIKNNIRQPEKYIKEIEKLSEVKAVSSRLKSTAMISTAYSSTGTIINGINPDSEIQVTRLYESIFAGEYFDNDDQIPIIIGRKLAKKLNAGVGDKLILSVPAIDGEVVYGAFFLKGIFNTQNDLFDGIQAYIKKEDLAELIGIDKETSSELAVSLYNTDLSEKIAKQVESLFTSEIEQEEIIIRNWKQIDITLSLLIDSMSYFSWFFIGIILIALAFGIVNTMLMVVLERVREIGMLMAIGMNKIRIFSMIMWETLFLSLSGGIIGMIFSMLFIAYFKHFGMDLSVVGEGMNAYGFSTIIYPAAPFTFYIEVLMMIILTAILASIFPAIKALKLNPAEAVRE